MKAMLRNTLESLEGIAKTSLKVIRTWPGGEQRYREYDIETQSPPAVAKGSCGISDERYYNNFHLVRCWPWSARFSSIRTKCHQRIVHCCLGSEWRS